MSPVMAEKQDASKRRIEQDAIIIDDSILSGGLIFRGIKPEQVPSPTYSISEAARFFFAKTSYWMRWRERKGRFVYNPGNNRKEEILPMRSEGGARLYRLPDIEKMAHGLAQQGLIEYHELVRVIRVIHAQAVLYGYIEDPKVENGKKQS